MVIVRLLLGLEKAWARTKLYSDDVPSYCAETLKGWSEPPALRLRPRNRMGKYNARKVPGVTVPSPPPLPVNQSEDEQQNNRADGSADDSGNKS